MKIPIKYLVKLENIRCGILAFLSLLAYAVSSVYYLVSTMYYAHKQGQRYRDFVCGIRVGEDRFARLSQKLVKDKRYQDLKIAVQDKAYRAGLYMEYEICRWDFSQEEI